MIRGSNPLSRIGASVTLFEATPRLDGLHVLKWQEHAVISQLILGSSFLNKYADLCKTGVKARVANPRTIRTQLTARNILNRPFAMKADVSVREVFEHLNYTVFKKSFLRLFLLLFRGSQFLPDWLYYRIFT
jgi:hypothetical protein